MTLLSEEENPQIWCRSEEFYKSAAYLDKLESLDNGRSPEENLRLRELFYASVETVFTTIEDPTYCGVMDHSVKRARIFIESSNWDVEEAKKRGKEWERILGAESCNNNFGANIPIKIDKAYPFGDGAVSEKYDI